MLERDLQDYLFENPDVLFPGEVVKRKRREVFIEGRRIDLLFEVDATQYIVELKRDTIGREDIGQVFEYYGLMRQSNETVNYKMILVAPSIPAYRRIPLEEFGIRCVEVQHLPESVHDQAELVKESIEYQKRERSDSALAAPLLNDLISLRFEDLLPPVTSKSLKLSHQLLKDGLPFIQKAFSEYEVLPITMNSSHSPDVICFPEAGSQSEARFTSGGAWWAFSFGHAEVMPKNDVPNISVGALPWGLDFAINAELRTSQEVMRQRIDRSPDDFDRLVFEHGGLELQTWLKLEHQPRFYHWVSLVKQSPGSWRGRDLLDVYRQSETDFLDVRAQWLGWIKDQRAELSRGQTEHLESRNRKLNLAIRLVRSFHKEDSVWDRSYDEQQAQFQAEYLKLKPLIEFFQ
jgi:hypothetical protein